MAYQIHTGRCEDVLKNLPADSIDALVTDAPYGLTDDLDKTTLKDVLQHWLLGEEFAHRGGGFMGKKWDSFVPSPAIFEEALRVLKPGAWCAVFAGSRTQDLMTLSLRLAGFEIKDVGMWLYGTGFPKSLNIAKAIRSALGTEAPEWEDFGTALKPAYEPFILCRKPLAGTYVQNIIRYGVGGLNIGACRIPTEEARAGGSGALLSDVRDGSLPEGVDWVPAAGGRWPANILHDGSDEVISLFPAQAGAAAPVRGTEPSAAGDGMVYGLRARVKTFFHGDQGSAARFFYCAKVTKAERDIGMERFIPFTASDMTGGRKEGSVGINDPRAGAGRTAGAKNPHPTVKPISLMSYVCRLVTPPGGTILDMFMGSGSTGCAAVGQGFGFVGIEMNPDDCVTSSARIGYVYKNGLEQPIEPKRSKNRVVATETQKITEVDLPVSKTWSSEVNQAFEGVAGAEVMPEHLQSKLKANINRLLLEGRSITEVISTAAGLVVSMEARA